MSKMKPAALREMFDPHFHSPRYHNWRVTSLATLVNYLGRRIMFKSMCFVALLLVESQAHAQRNGAQPQSVTVTISGLADNFGGAQKHNGTWTLQKAPMIDNTTWRFSYYSDPANPRTSPIAWNCDVQIDGTIWVAALNSSGSGQLTWKAVGDVNTIGTINQWQGGQNVLTITATP